MKNIKFLITSALITFTGVSLASANLKVTNKSDTSVKVYVGCRNTQETDPYYTTVGFKASAKSLADARASNAATIIAPNSSVSIPYAHSPRGIIVDFLNSSSNSISKTISFPFAETNSEIYVLGGTDATLGAIAQSVAYWNNDAVKTVFPSGLVGSNSDGTLSSAQISTITPDYTDVKAWNYNVASHANLMLTMYDQDLQPKVAS